MSANTPPNRPSLFQRFMAHPLNSEMVAVLALMVAFIISSRLSRHFLDIAYLLRAPSDYIEGGILALGLTFIIIAGQIDISVASNLALTGTLLGVMHTRQHLSLGVSLLLALTASALMGAFNGVLVAKSRLPSLAVTLGTFALYRGIAQALIGDGSATGFPEGFNNLDYRYVAGLLPLPLALFLALAVLHGLVLHRTVFGRRVYAIGTSEPAARYSGIPVAKTQIAIFTLTGFLAGVCGILMTSRYTVARFDMAMGLELDAITAVVLGGTNIFGGRGTIFGTVIAFFLMVIVRTGMGLANIKAEKQLIVIGALLLLSIVTPNLLRRGARE